MTINYTPNYNLGKPVAGSEIDQWAAPLNSNCDILDANLKAVSDIANAALPKAGGTMTGNIVLPGNPTLALEAAPKQYVDTFLLKAGGTMTGLIVLSGAGVAANNPVTVTQLNLKSDKGVADGQTSYSVSSSFALADAGATVLGGAAGAIVLTVLPQASVVWLARTRIDIIRTGAGEVSIAPGAGVTIVSDGSKLRLNAQYSGATLYRQGSDSWILVGNLKT